MFCILIRVFLPRGFVRHRVRHKMATGSNATPMGSLHPIFESRAKEFQRPSMNPQLQSHIEAAKRAAEIAASSTILIRLR